MSTPQRVALRPRRGLGRVQAQLLTSQRLHPDAPLANMAVRSLLDGTVDPERFVEAFDRVVFACTGLRTVLVDVAGTTVPRLLDQPPAVTTVVDIAQDAAGAWCAERLSVPLDPAQCAYDSVLLRHETGRWSWYLAIHHVATDAASHAIVHAATSAAYAGEPLPPLTSFADHVAAVDAAGDDAAWQATAAWWTQQAPQSAPLSLYGPRGAPTTLSDRRDVLDGPHDEEAVAAALAGEFRSISRELSLLVLLGTTAAAWVHRLTGRREVVFGVPVHHRTTPAARSVVGPVMELFPLVVEVEPDDTFRALRNRVHRGVVNLLRQARPGTSPSPNFEIVLNVLTATYGDVGDVPTTTEWLHAGHVDPGHLLRLQAYDHDGRSLQLQVDVNRALAGDIVRPRVPAHLRAVLRRVAADLDEAIGAAPVVTGSEELAELTLLNHDPPVRPPFVPVGRQVDERLASLGDAPLLEADGVEITAAELDRWADGLAAWLTAQGVVVGDRVGIRLGRQPATVAAVLACFRVGAAFVMLDPSDPPARHEHIAADAGLRIVLDLVPDAEDLAATTSGPRHEPGPDELAYVLYTSGSTGMPKGVPIPHLGLTRYLGFAVDAYVDPGDPPTVPLHSSLSFDLSITSLFLPLLTGGRLVIYRESTVDALERIAADDRIDFLKATPSQLQVYLRFVDEPRPLQVVVVGGEAFRRPLATRLLQACTPGVRVINEYGPTEAVVGCMEHLVDLDTDCGPDVPIGRAAPDADIFILDGHGHRSPAGAWGELYVRRPGMASGYLGRPDLTAERFVTIDWLGDELLYRTGDRVRVDRPGVAVFGGRVDDQLKVGGIRLEPGEIEAVLVEHPAVQECVVRVWTPSGAAEARRCARCGLREDTPGTTLDEERVCSACRDYDRIRVQANAWFRTEDDLAAELSAARARATGDHDCLHLLSGGKDSTYALYQLVAAGWRVHALTLDNGFISDEAKDNIRRSVADLGISHEFVSTPAMEEIFRDSLERHSNVCNGCYKTIYTFALLRAHALGIPVIVTGLSRGQFFETRLVPQQFTEDRFDPDAIDAAVLAARKVYHRSDDAVAQHLDVDLLQHDAIFDEIRFVDFYRYVDVDLADLYRFLEERAPWVRPADTGRSTNCLINVAGIAVHTAERGYHNYALPYAWDVRLGHKTRDEALAELEDDLDEAEVDRLLARIGYEVQPRRVLTAWYTAAEPVDPGDLRRHLRKRLPEWALPAAFVHVDALPLATSAKVDLDRLPAPTRVDRGGELVAPTNAIEAELCRIWADVLGVEGVGIDDDFFDIGGESLDALKMITDVQDMLGVDVAESVAFEAPTVRELALVIAAALHAGRNTTTDAAGPPAEAAIDVTAASDELTSGQAGLLYEVRADPTSPRYGVTHHYTVAGGLDAGRLRRALEAVVGAHDTLRTTFGTPRRRLDVGEALSWTELPAGVDVQAVADTEARRTFDVDEGPLVRATVAPGDPAHVVLALHHLWCDAGSLDRLWDQVAVVYGGGPPPRVTTTYTAHAAAQGAAITEADRAWWRTALPDDATAADLALARPRVAEPDGYRTARLDLPARPAAVFASFLTAVDVVLNRLAAGPLVVGVPVSTRDEAAEDLVGYFLATLPVALPDPASATAGQIVDRIRRDLAGLLAHRSVPLADVLADRRTRGLSDKLFSLMAVHAPRSAPSLPGLDVNGTVVPNGAAVTDLSLLLLDGGGTDLAVAAEWRGDRFAAEDVALLVAEVVEVLQRAVAQPDLSARDLLRGTAPEDLVGSALPEPLVPVVDDIWAGAADDTALRLPDGSSRTYAQLRADAERVAGALARSGVRTGDHVGVALRRGPELVTAILGTLRLGAAYVPVDPTYPAARVRTLLDRAEVAAVVAEPDLADLGDGTAPILRPADLVAPDDPPALPAMPTLDDPAYLIHTSGSTGTPRGVLVRHAQLAASTAARRVWYGAAPSRFLWTPSPGFDSSVAGLFWTLTTGGELIVPSDDEAIDPARLAELIATADVTHVLMVPALWRAVLRRLDGPCSLAAVIVAGEAAPLALVDEHVDRLGDVPLWNEYGPTEATVWATVHACQTGEDPVPIGGPVPGARVRVVAPASADLAPLPPGAVGELLVGGAGLTEGYWRDETTTAERFVRDVQGRRWYRTGDRVRCRDDVLEFLGRLDDQLNLHGVRVEPEEIESALLALDGIRAALVRVEHVVAGDVLGALTSLSPAAARMVLRAAADEEQPAAALVAGLGEATGGRSMLVAHVEAATGDEQAWRAALRAALPAALVPARIVRHERLPRTPHGKLDRRAALPMTFTGAGSAAPSTPLTVVAGRVLSVWQELLDAPGLGVDDDVYDAGADSMATLTAAEALAEVLGTDVSIRSIVEGRTARRIAAALTSTDDIAADRERVVVLQTGRTDVAPLLTVAPSDNSLTWYGPLVAALGRDVGVLGLLLPAGDLEDLRTIEAIADSLLLAVRAAQPSGPVRLFGVSTSGLVAYELAQRLRADGRTIDLVGLGDTFFPGENERLEPIWRRWVRRRWHRYSTLVRDGDLRGAAVRLRDAARRRTSAAQRSDDDRDRSSGHREETAERTLVRALARAEERYRPAPLLVPVVLYAASATDPARTVARWRPLLRDLEVVNVDGTHGQPRFYLDPSRVGAVADDLRRRLLPDD